MEQISLYILLIAALTAVAGLSVALYRCRRRLAQCQRVMVRCINENLDMKEKLPEHELPHFLNREEITPEEFTRIIHNMLKRMMLLFMFLPFLSSCSKDRISGWSGKSVYCCATAAVRDTISSSAEIIIERCMTVIRLCFLCRADYFSGSP